MEQKDAQLEQAEQPEDSQVEDNMASLLEQEGLEIDFPSRGEIREGVVASISQGQILVGVGAKSEGIISGREYDQIPPEELEKLEVGQEISVYVLNPEDSHGNLVLSLTRALEEKSWKTVEKLLESKEAYHSTIRGYNKGGLIVPVEGLNGFVPASQVSLSRRVNVSGDTPEKRWGSMVGEEVDVCVIEVDRERRRLILSERAASSETRESVKEKVLDELTEGETRTGRVTSLADFGAFVNISGADGLVHLSELSWDRIQHPSEVLKVGQEVDVKIISIDREKKRIGLSLRQTLPDPWISRIEKYEVGQLLEGKITRLTKFGAFARIEEDLEGLIHISEISERRIEHPKEVLKEGDDVTVRVIKIDPENHRVGLSIRRVDSMAYADMDWKTLEDIVFDDVDDDESESDESKAQEGEAPASEAQAGEAVETESSDTPEAEAPKAVETESSDTPEAETPKAEEIETPDAPEAEVDETPESTEAEGNEEKEDTAE